MAYQSRQRRLEYLKEYSQKPDNKRKARDRVYRHLYGIGLEEYESLVLSQWNRCAICGNLPGAKRRLFVDHDHSTNKVRQLLCLQCNHGMERVDNIPDWCQKAIEYKLKHA